MRVLVADGDMRSTPAGIVTWFNRGSFQETPALMKLINNARSSGVPVVLELYRGLTHDFIKMGRALKEAAAAQAVAAQALKDHWNLP